MTTPLHDDELTVDVALVRSLIEAQFPRYASEEVSSLPRSGSSNALFRLGADKLVRLPRQPGGGSSIAKEARWLPNVARQVSTCVPAIIGLGAPTSLFPELWAVTDWVEGQPPGSGTGRSQDTDGLARDLSEFLIELRTMPLPHDRTPDPELSWYRSEPLHEVDEDFEEALAQCRRLGVELDLDRAARLWTNAVAASRGRRVGSTWLHGDLAAENLVVDQAGRLAGVLDFGGLAIGDPTVDLVIGWELLDGRGRQILGDALGADDATWAVARGWALFIAVITFPYYGASMPARCAARLRMARAAIEDA